MGSKMNERIKELAEQAGGIQYDEDGDELTPILVGKDLAKFAELIVLETLDQVNKNMELTWPEGEVKIKQYFGVNE